MASSLIPFLLLTSSFGEPPRGGSIFDNYGLQRSPYYYPPRDFFAPSIFDRSPLESFWPSAWKGFNELAIPNYLDKEGLNIVLNVQGYRPDELEVRVITRQVIVRGKHEEEIETVNKNENNNNNNQENNNQDTEVVRPEKPGKALRQFERRFIVPANVDLDKITTTVSSDNILTIRAPYKDVPKQDEGKKVTIEQTGKPALKPQESENKNEVNNNEVNIETKRVHTTPGTTSQPEFREITPEISREPESREETVDVKKNIQENDIDGVSITTVPEESTTPLK